MLILFIEFGNMCSKLPPSSPTHTHGEIGLFAIQNTFWPETNQFTHVCENKPISLRVWVGDEEGALSTWCQSLRIKWWTSSCSENYFWINIFITVIIFIIIYILIYYLYYYYQRQDIHVGQFSFTNTLTIHQRKLTKNVSAKRIVAFFRFCNTRQKHTTYILKLQNSTSTEHLKYSLIPPTHKKYITPETIYH